MTLAELMELKPYLYGNSVLNTSHLDGHRERI